MIYVDLASEFSDMIDFCWLEQEKIAFEVWSLFEISFTVISLVLYEKVSEF